MASIDRRPNGTYRARWREYPGGPQHTKAFTRKVDAERWLVKAQHDILSGVYVAPEAARTTLEGYSVLWLERMTPTWRSKTAELHENNLRRHIVPTLGARSLSSIRRSDVEALCASLPLAPSTVGVVHQHLRELLEAAVEDGLLARNPANKARLPRADAEKPQPVERAVLDAIAAELPDWMKIVVPLGVGAGLRQGEVSGLTVDRLNLLRRTLRVDRQLQCVAGGVGELAPAKTESSNRTVPLPTVLVDALAAHLVDHPQTPEGFVLVQPGRGPVDSNQFGHAWRAACKAAKVPGLRYHRLRHTYASTLLSHGVNVKAVADWLGHASPTITLSTYAHLMPSDDDVARGVLDDVLASAAQDVGHVSAG